MLSFFLRYKVVSWLWISSFGLVRVFFVVLNTSILASSGMHISVDGFYENQGVKDIDTSQNHMGILMRHGET